MKSTFTEEDYQLIEQEFSGLREASRKRCANRQEYETVLKAFDFANDAHKNVRRRSGDPYILHPIAVAKIVVSEIGLGYKSISAALLHDVVEDTDFTVDDIRRNFGDKIASLVDGLTKIKTALDGSKDTTSLQAENFKRILLTLNDDVRIVLIKLADRLHNVRTIEFMPEYKRDKILSETMYIFAPLAHRLGLYAIKSEMENIWLKFREPEAYQDIVSRLENIDAERREEMETFTESIRRELEKAGYGDSKILKRLKSPYSIWNKMNTKNLPFEEIYDLYAIRIIFKPKEEYTEREQCWHIFTKITALYPYKADRTRDWTKEPKSNGYEALHLTVMSPGGNWVEVQIRSERMDSIAERGVAAHWLYKKNGEANQETSDFEVDNWLKKVREIIENPDANAIQFLDDFHKELTTADIFVFTPKGETRRLEKGSTVLDFAYSIHTDIGNKAIAGKVNQKLVPLSQVLHSGDQVEIISSVTGSPKREWLDFLKTTKAKSLVMESLKKNTKDSIGEGFRILDKRLNDRGIAERIKVMKRLLAYYKCETKDQFYAKIGLGVLTLDDLDKALRASAPASEGFLGGINKLFRPKSNGKEIDRKKEYIIGEGSENTNYIIADCCNPVPGDSALGIIDDQGRVVVHKKSCKVVNDLASKMGEKVIAVRWSDKSVMRFLTKIVIQGIDRAGLLNDITKVISSELNINMRKIMFEAHDGVFEGSIELYVRDKADIESLTRRIGAVRGLESVTRAEINQ
ncbi:MAG: bifunctional (p)ppGpp synthetase/guanosine-3',5'-bis(diphosphate) 3'-pyrophosphohydrolase [Bacteroidales bacterium]|nr:bifunctional (p)ppGpp synthetase/guanosine-3',5'-bis(diphosphate) 3'-pyrophosphohydrolase [Bacteroidales bacterium]